MSKEPKDFLKDYGCESVGYAPVINAMKAYAEQEKNESVAIIALEEIVNPIKFMQDRLKEGEKLEGTWAVLLSKDASYLREIAEKALKIIKK